jgi:hypothetical protein
VRVLDKMVLNEEISRRLIFVVSNGELKRWDFRIFFGRVESCAISGVSASKNDGYTLNCLS